MHPNTSCLPVLEIDFGPLTAESKNLKYCIKFDLGDIFRFPCFLFSNFTDAANESRRAVREFQFPPKKQMVNKQQWQRGARTGEGEEMLPWMARWATSGQQATEATWCNMREDFQCC